MASGAPQNSTQWLLKAKKTKKPHFVKRGFFILGLVNGLRGPPKQYTMAFKGQKNEKTTLCKTWFFHCWARGIPEDDFNMASRAPQNSTQWLLKVKKTKKPHFVKRGFFIVGVVAFLKMATTWLPGPPKNNT